MPVQACLDLFAPASMGPRNARQTDSKNRTLAQGALDGNGPRMQVRHTFNNSQPQARAGNIAHIGRAVKTVKQAG